MNKRIEKKLLQQHTHTYVLKCERACSTCLMLMLIVLTRKKIYVYKMGASKLTHKDKEENILGCTLITFMRY